MVFHLETKSKSYKENALIHIEKVDFSYEKEEEKIITIF